MRFDETCVCISTTKAFNGYVNDELHVGFMSEIYDRKARTIVFVDLAVSGFVAYRKGTNNAKNTCFLRFEVNLPVLYRSTISMEETSFAETCMMFS